MTDLELINAFLAKETLSETERILKNKCILLDGRIKTSSKELSSLTEQQSAKQGEVVALSQQLEGILQVIIEISKNSAAKEEEVPAPPEVEYLDSPAE